MPRTCLACSHAEREAIDKALVAGEPLRNISKRVSISPAALVRHKSHVAGALAKAQARREEKLRDTIFDEMRRVLAKAWELLGKFESGGDYRGAIVALREVRECLASLNGLVTKAESGSGGITVTVEHIGAGAECITMEREQATSTPSNNQQSPANRAALPPSSSATEADSQSSGVAIMPTRKIRPLVGAVGYLEGIR